MPRTPIHNRYRRMIYEAGARFTPAAEILIQLRSMAPEHGWDDVPSQRTIHRVLHDFYQEPESLRTLWKPVQWPWSFQLGDLPWEAQAATLDFQNFTRSIHDAPPLVGQAIWWWRLYQARPDVPPAIAYTFSALLAGLTDTDPDYGEMAQVLAGRLWLTDPEWQRKCH